MATIDQTPAAATRTLAMPIAAALKDAALAALVAFGLFALLLGLYTDTGPTGALHRLREQVVGLRRFAGRRQHVRSVEELRGDVVAADEAAQIDVAGLLRRERIELFRR